MSTPDQTTTPPVITDGAWRLDPARSSARLDGDQLTVHGHLHAAGKQIVRG